MQYLLSEEEYKALLSRHAKAIEHLETQIQELCTQVCNVMPIVLPWRKNEPPEPWGCMLSTDEGVSCGYCDECPVQDKCPNRDKRWSQ